MTTTVLPEADSDALWLAMDQAAGGDVIQCPAGVYAPFWAPARIHEPAVTIEPVKGAAPVFTEIGIGQAGGYILQDLDVAMDPGTQYGVEINRAINVIVRRCDVHQADHVTFSGVGVFIRDSTDVVVEQNRLWALGDGIDGLGDEPGLCQRIGVFANELQDIGANFMFFAGCSRLAFLFNRGARSHFPEGVHPDFLQLANNGAVTYEAVDIRENRYERGDGDPSQGIFVTDGRDVRIIRNAMIGAATNGISCSRTKGLQLRENFVQPYGSEGTSIIVRGAADRVELLDNWGHVAVGVSGEDQPTNVHQAGTVDVEPSTGPGDRTEYDRWRASLPPPEPPDPCAAEKATIAALQAEVDRLNRKLAAA